MIEQITIKKPDDWHCHFRDDDFLTRTVPDTARYCARAIVMPNLKDPIDSAEKMVSYYQRIKRHIQPERNFEPLMTLYIKQSLTPAIIQEAFDTGLLKACKYYPAGVTTNSENGVATISMMRGVLEKLDELGLPLLVHGETSDPLLDIFDREVHFIDHELQWLLKNFPNLKIVLEHITTEYAVKTVENGSKNLAATITAHHLYIDRNDLLSGGVKPDLYCLPIAKRASDRQALVKAATSASPKFFMGTDSAPHTCATKYSACGCAGIYTAFHALPLYASIFEAQKALDKFENFASVHGASFYGLPVNGETMTLIKSPWTVPEKLAYGSETVTPFMAGKELAWQVK
jgi:dihydroorotase